MMMDNARIPSNAPSKSLRAVLHLKHSVINNTPESSATQHKHRHGRRLIQMLFRSNNEDDIEEEAPNMVSTIESITSPVSIQVIDARHEDNELSNGTGQFSALKRKLFPSRRRRQPVRVPPLIISPIATNQTQMQHHSCDGMTNNAGGDNIRSISSAECRGADETDIPERDGDITGVPLSSTNALMIQEDALAEITTAIEEIQQWRKQHEIDTENAIQDVIRKVDSAMTPLYQDEAEAQLESERLEEEYLRNQRQSEQARMQLSLALKQTEDCFLNTRQEDEVVVRLVAGVESNSRGDDDQDLMKLRNDVFDLKVKELRSKLKASWLNTFEGEDVEMDMKILDIESFTSELDQVLAQFPSSTERTKEEETSILSDSAT